MEITQRPQITTKSISDNRATFTITPLEPGFGYTVGNSLRRTLLSSIPGAAVTSIKIDGVKHEFQVVDGVKEDVVEIIQNIKELVISSIIDEPVTMLIEKKGSGEITASDIKTPAGVEIFDKKHHIATLSKGEISIELTVERGRGYVPAEINKRIQKAEVGRIVVDSIYSPVLKVAYNVEATRVGEHTNFDSLTLDVTTKTAISPVDAMASAGKTLTELFGLVNHLNINAEGLDIPSEDADILGFGLASASASEEISLEEIGVPPAMVQVLNRNNIRTVQDLSTMTTADLKALDGVGDKKVEQISKIITDAGYSLAE
jgi:DNA-directed RNA polymerase subunit alpha